MGDINPIPQGTENADQALSVLGQLFARLGIGGDDSTSPPATPPPAADGVTMPPEDFAALQAQVADLVTQITNQADAVTEVTGQRDEFKQQVETLQTALSTMEEARSVERFKAMAEGYAHLPPATDDLAAHLRWLYTADTEDEQPHAKFFAKLLQKADEQYVQAFKERGVSHGAAADAMGQIDRAVNEYITKNTGVAYTVALDAVIAANPKLYALYEEQRGGTQ